MFGPPKTPMRGFPLAESFPEIQSAHPTNQHSPPPSVSNTKYSSRTSKLPWLHITQHHSRLHLHAGSNPDPKHKLKATPESANVDERKADLKIHIQWRLANAPHPPNQSSCFIQPTRTDSSNHLDMKKPKYARTTQCFSKLVSQAYATCRMLIGGKGMHRPLAELGNLTLCCPSSSLS